MSKTRVGKKTATRRLAEKRLADRHLADGALRRQDDCLGGLDDILFLYITGSTKCLSAKWFLAERCRTKNTEQAADFLMLIFTDKSYKTFQLKVQFSVVTLGRIHNFIFYLNCEWA